jgi:hypothetical protein
MKHIGNLPRNLRTLFSVLRVLVLLLGIFWFFNLTFNSWVQRRFTDNPRLMVSVGDVQWTSNPKPVALPTDQAAAALAVTSPRGSLQVDLLSRDADLISATRKTLLPAMLLIVASLWVLFTALRAVCLNIERGEVFSHGNLLLVRRIGMILIGYSLASAAVQLWANFEMGGYLRTHAATTMLLGTIPGDAAAPLRFSVAAGQLPLFATLVAGALVLMLTEAFRQGLALKTENDLTV